MTMAATLGGHAVKAAVERAGIDAAEVDDVIMGCATPEGATGSNIARQIALRRGLPITTSGMTVNRFCSSGLQTIAMAAQRVIAGENDVVVAGGVESISCVQNEANKHMIAGPVAGRAQADDLAGTCCRRRSRSPSATTSRASAWTRYGAASQQKATRGEGARPLRRGNDPVTTLAGVADAQLGPAHEGSHHQRRRRASGRERPTTASRTSSRRFPAA
jgi:acetyl-CoA C-acetyltransferase